MADERTIVISPQTQDIKTEVTESEHTFNPESVRRFFTSNVITRVWARLYGWTGSQAVRLACTASGYLKVSSTGTIFQHNVVAAGNAPDAYGAAIDLGAVRPRLDIMTWDFACVIKRSLDDVTYDSEFEVPANYFMSIDCDTRYIKIKNKVALSVCRYQFNGFY
jgi:hypothetical protein